MKKVSGYVTDMQRVTDNVALDTDCEWKLWQATESRYGLQRTLFWGKFSQVLSASYLNYAA